MKPGATCISDRHHATRSSVRDLTLAEAIPRVSTLPTSRASGMSLPPLSPFSVFLALAGVGFLFLLVSVIFGELFDQVGADHDVDMGGPGFFSGRVMSVFVTTFGGFGAVGTYYGLSPVTASMFGFASGLVFAGVIYAFARFLYGQQASSQVDAADLVGQSARVVIAIPAGGVGQIRCRVGEELVDKVAQSRDGVAIPENASVRIDDILGETVIVKKH
jgi:membrane protein implicated in regulation of membrane protease activity